MAPLLDIPYVAGTPHAFSLKHHQHYDERRKMG